MRKLKTENVETRIVDNFKRPTTKRPNFPDQPTDADFKQTLNIIEEAKDLYQELHEAGVNILNVANLITYMQYEDKVWIATHESRSIHNKRAIDFKKKIMFRHPEFVNKNEKQRKQFIQQLVRLQAISNDPLFRNKLSLNKRRPYFSKYVLLLESLLNITKKPFRYMAALIGLFYLTPGGTCVRCRRKKNNTCTPLSVFQNCLSHDSIRKSLWNIADAQRKISPLPDDFLVRISSSKNKV
ncbi:MAG: hypothetical protein WAW31_06510 [Smithella sp.]